MPVSTYAHDTSAEAFCLVERTGGEVSWPHDSPEVAFQVWAKTDLAAEQAAYLLAIGAVTAPPADPHCNSVGTPTMYSYGREEGGWYVWQATIPFEFNMIQ